MALVSLRLVVATLSSQMEAVLSFLAPPFDRPLPAVGFLNPAMAWNLANFLMEDEARNLAVVCALWLPCRQVTAPGSCHHSINNRFRSTHARAIRFYGWMHWLEFCTAAVGAQCCIEHRCPE